MPGLKLPRLHVVTDDAVCGRSDFVEQAAGLMTGLGDDVALHLRAPCLSARQLHELAVALAPVALQSGALLLINGRVDIALAVRSGAHLNQRSVPVAEARRLLHHAWLGYSAHTLVDAGAAAAEGADFVTLGTIYESASHPDRPAAGVQLVEQVARAMSVPVIAIGGITGERVPEVMRAGAHGAAVIRAVWSADDPMTAARELLRIAEGEKWSK